MSSAAAVRSTTGFDRLSIRGVHSFPERFEVLGSCGGPRIGRGTSEDELAKVLTVLITSDELAQELGGTPIPAASDLVVDVRLQGVGQGHVHRGHTHDRTSSWQCLSTTAFEEGRSIDQSKGQQAVYPGVGTLSLAIGMEALNTSRQEAFAADEDEGESPRTVSMPSCRSLQWSRRGWEWPRARTELERVESAGGRWMWSSALGAFRA